jgi:glyoxylase-like metal-dependent hydrolase (beta-lactamase superfamily II)/rhodanese-related sulfurtransferase
MLFRQFVDDDLGCGSYLVGDGGEAVVVDPAFAIEHYLEAAHAWGVRIVRVLETHTHADHLSGHGRLALELGLPVSIHPLARPEYPFDQLEDEAVISVGSVGIRVVHTPGHRPEHCSFVVAGELALTGDSLFVGDAARPDLAIEAREGAADLFRSLRRLADLPDSIVVYPGHLAGSLCGTNMSEDRSTSIGREKETNRAFTSDERSFVVESVSVGTPRPPTAERLVALNRGPWVAARPALEPVDEAADAIVLDVRPVDVFAAGHLAGAINVPLDGGSFATRSAFVLDPAERVLVCASSPDEAQQAARHLWAVGLFELGGYLVSPRATEPTTAVSVPELARLLRADGDLQLLDVREDRERESIVSGSTAVPYRLLRLAPPGDLEPARPVYVICESGARASLGASLLARQGYDARPVLGGGVDDLAELDANLITSG